MLPAYRWKMKECLWMKKLLTAFLCMVLFCGIAEGQDYMKVVINKNDAPLRAAPSDKGKILVKWSGGESSLIVDPKPIRTKGEKSSWYKVIFTVFESDGTITQTHKVSHFGFSYPYINVKDVEKVPMSDVDLGQIDYFRRGRPVLIRVGDDFSEYLWEGASELTLPTDLTLLTEPKIGAEKIRVPKGIKVYELTGTEYVYHDMDEKGWVYFVGCKDKRFLGWMTQEDGVKVYEVIFKAMFGK
jgi:hypothetical protein